MEPRDFETIDQFLKLVEKNDLLEYYSLAAESGEDVIEEAVKKRRSWAQGQQSNPKYRGEALWIIKNMALVRRALIEERSAYLVEVSRRQEDRNVEKLTVFIEGSLADGALTPQKEAAIFDAAARLGVARERAAERISALRAQTGGVRSTEKSTAPDSFVDYYQALRVPADARTAEIEEAHRGRYREARDLADKGRASDQYALLDEAWRVLKDPERRASYDRRRSEYMAELERRATSADAEFKRFLPPPVKKRSQRASETTTRPESRPPDVRAPEPEHGADGDAMEFVLTPDSRVVHEAPPPRPNRGGPTMVPSHSTTAPPPPRPAPAAPTGGQPMHSLASAPTAPAAPVVHPSSQRPMPTPSAPPPMADPNEAARSAAAMGAGYNPPRQRQRAPQLEIDGKEVHKVRAGNNPIAVQFVVRNAGQGQMSGRVLSDREWVVVNPARLDPSKREQVVEAVVHPRQMPRRQAISLVTVVADHGERRSVTIDVERQVLPIAAYVAIGAMSLLLLVIIAILVT